jgi:hypothetical protein
MYDTVRGGAVKGPDGGRAVSTERMARSACGWGRVGNSVHCNPE